MTEREFMRYIDLFAGSGGLSLGLYNAGLHGIFAVERNKDAFSTLKYNLIERKNHFLWPNWLEMKNWDHVDAFRDGVAQSCGIQRGSGADYFARIVAGVARH